MKRLLLLAFFFAIPALGANVLLGSTNSVTKPSGVHSFKNGTLCLSGASSGCMQFEVSAAAGTTPLLFPGGGGTVAYLDATQTFTNKSIAFGQLTGLGSGVGTWLGTPTGANLMVGILGCSGTTNFLRADGTCAAPASGASLSTANTWTKTQSVTSSALTDAANIAVDGSLSNNFTVTLGGNRTLDNPTNLVGGTTYNFYVEQDGTGSRTLAYGNKYKFAGGIKTLSTAASAKDLISCYYDSTDDILLCVLAKAFS